MKVLRRSVTLVMGACLLWPVSAVAANGEQVGKNLGDMLGSIGKSLYIGIAGLVAVMFLFNRRYSDLAIFIVAAVVIGGVVLAPGDFTGTVRDIWHSIAG